MARFPYIFFRKTWWFVLVLGIALSCDQATTNAKKAYLERDNIPDSEKPVLRFSNPVFNFGTLRQGEEVSHDFSFKNSGKSDLLIAFASASCGCTVPTWPKEPIPPGGTGVIKATFNSEGKEGKQNKKIVITANTKPELTEIFLEGEVLPDTSRH
jgi:hypothetical protein